MNQYGKVAVIMGGSSAEREVSLMSGAGVLAALQASGIDAHAFDPAEKPLQLLKAEGFDRAFLILHGRGGEDGTIQGALEFLGVPYTGCGVMASAIGMDKWRTKLLWEAAGLPVPDYRIVESAEELKLAAQELSLPLFVKPANEGSSVGVVKLKSLLDVDAAWAEVSQHKSVVLAERNIGGGEYTCAVLDGQALPTVKIIPQTEFYDYESKYIRDDTVYHCPSGLSGEKEQQARSLAEKAYRILGATGWARIDFLTDEDGKIYLLEANTAPGMTTHSLFPMCAREAGLSYESLVMKILATTL
ncbi:D-alanine--D-alanine ligase [Deefgea tanakiae]|uniref:D-alanine--D-alanine ligase n=1 Tax=Deefgea tanakiae TaxID=2865840 RepID=A0ABX8Z9I6_9NEIS|nr:D-alanine--D-alanine ligase [Deefgea tanakiae]QZA77820.1 D-alanine--D-alanine ligase [Deefgea tanakiae]